MNSFSFPFLCSVVLKLWCAWIELGYTHKTVYAVLCGKCLRHCDSMRPWLYALPLSSSLNVVLISTGVLKREREREREGEVRRVGPTAKAKPLLQRQCLLLTSLIIPTLCFWPTFPMPSSYPSFGSYWVRQQALGILRYLGYIHLLLSLCCSLWKQVHGSTHGKFLTCPPQILTRFWMWISHNE